MGYTAQEMVDQVGVYLAGIKMTKNYDPDSLTPQTRELLLNRSQRKVTSLIHTEYLSTHEVLEEGVTLTNGVVAIADLAEDPIYSPRGFIGIKITDGAFCDRQTIQEYMEFVRQGRSFTTAKPLAYIYAENIYVLPATAAEADIYMIKKPVDIALTGSVACALEDELQEVVIDYACYLGFMYLKDLERANAFWEQALYQITIMNKRVDPDYSVITSLSREAFMRYNRKSEMNGEFDIR